MQNIIPLILGAFVVYLLFFRKSKRFVKEVKDMAVDPVCNMNVDEKKAAATYEYKGKTYYFCAAGCKESFAKNPEKYLNK
ncbi:MAG TPA: YHS domain-containing protein [Bacteroidales bacterium]|nr:YHS domain-containing protein [Bacteroidales bacterium]